MSKYLLSFVKKRPHLTEGCEVLIYLTEPWDTVIDADSLDIAKEAAKHIGSALRRRLPKGYRIALESVEFVY